MHISYMAKGRHLTILAVGKHYLLSWLKFARKHLDTLIFVREN